MGKTQPDKCLLCNKSVFNKNRGTGTSCATCGRCHFRQNGKWVTRGSTDVKQARAKELLAIKKKKEREKKQKEKKREATKKKKEREAAKKKRDAVKKRETAKKKKEREAAKKKRDAAKKREASKKKKS